MKKGIIKCRKNRSHSKRPENQEYKIDLCLNTEKNIP